MQPKATTGLGVLIALVDKLSDKGCDSMRSDSLLFAAVVHFDAVGAAFTDLALALNHRWP
jgi:hypothetical protein